MKTHLIRVDDAMYRRVSRAAKADRRSVTNWLRRFLSLYLDKITGAK